MIAPANSPDTVWINGTPRPLGAASIPDLLREIGHDPAMAGIAVAVNDAVVPRREWGDTTLVPGDRIEIVCARQGG